MSDFNPTRDEMMSAMFAHMVMQQTNMAMMLLGKIAHPETGKTIQNLEAAKLCIDLLEMLQTKTKGNLNKEEENLLKHNVMSLQMNFVETANEAEKSKPAENPAEQKEVAQSTPESKNPAEPVSETAASATDESHKKFVKKY